LQHGGKFTVTGARQQCFFPDGESLRSPPMPSSTISDRTRIAARERKQDRMDAWRYWLKPATGAGSILGKGSAEGWTPTFLNRTDVTHFEDVFGGFQGKIKLAKSSQSCLLRNDSCCLWSKMFSFES
jgi:hypothetical protein